jgi:hypothetical protein
MFSAEDMKQNEAQIFPFRHIFSADCNLQDNDVSRLDKRRANFLECIGCSFLSRMQQSSEALDLSPQCGVLAPSGRVVTEVTLDHTLGNWRHFITILNVILQNVKCVKRRKNQTC